MSRKRRSFQRLQGTRRYKKLFIVVAEGVKTESQYFSIFNNFSELKSTVSVKVLKKPATRNSPAQVLKKMKDFLKKESFRPSDEAWLVVDKDEWPEIELKKLLEWEKEQQNYGLAISNPCFEYWLLLHFQNAKLNLNSNSYLSELKKYLPRYQKNIDRRKFTKEKVEDAIRRAARQNVSNDAVLCQAGSTTVNNLVERILDTGSC